MAGEEGADSMIVRNVVRATGEERWLLNKVSLLRGADGEVRRVINVIEDVSSVKRAERSQRMLAQASEALAGSLDYARDAAAVAEVAVPGLADCAAVDMLGRGGRTEQVAIASSGPEAVERARLLRERFTVDARRAPGRCCDDAELGSLMVVALEAGWEALGLIAFANADASRAVRA